ncbi:hypothetical protein AGMMS49574_16360 [Bacteroidia bacterium]|nr:hypothetical protein AGMMS49574_16360 [Bacteroidia bacterium]
MSQKILFIFLLIATCNVISAQAPGQMPPAMPSQMTATEPTTAEQELIDLCKQKWLWMADKDMTKLDNLFDEKSVFIHMGGAGDKAQEMATIEQSFIHYKHAEVFETAARIIDNTAVVLNRIRLTAVVGGNEVVNPFMVTETYVKKGGEWKLAALAFTRLMGN